MAAIVSASMISPCLMNTNNWCQYNWCMLQLHLILQNCRDGQKHIISLYFFDARFWYAHFSRDHEPMTGVHASRDRWDSDHLTVTRAEGPTGNIRATVVTVDVSFSYFFIFPHSRPLRGFPKISENPCKVMSLTLLIDCVYYFLELLIQPFLSVLRCSIHS